MRVRDIKIKVLNQVNDYVYGLLMSDQYAEHTDALYEVRWYICKLIHDLEGGTKK